ncbi:rRNA N6-adenosine-methyltransferase ZCCHC4 isoform X2 [Folsomia candida]|uniref:rRNA N6-adenosine-methyltransferase ZCCHC4 isoform X2 n=1 Tax=Folsomia candida TaxID=158441 RepID=UPI001604F16F|nr:rRNA N6-adenosine-methyltransferase ZCCHC4 isoform X2 [Folsomia candida]
MKPKFKKEFVNPNPQEFYKTVAVIRDLKLNPSCEHGPTILFERNGSRFFSCSAYRCRKLCPFYLSEEEWIPPEEALLASPNSKKRKMMPNDDDNVKRNNDSNKNMPSLPPPTQRDMGEAQYHFTEQTVNFFIKLFQDVGISNIICIGTPSLHHFFKRHPSLKIDSFLLDIDERLIQQFPATECAYYNMCNHHFFDDGRNGRENYDKFLQNSESLAIVTDPPFGAKVELIWNGALSSVQKDFRQYHSQSSNRCEVLWIFPYFMEGHILNKCPDSNLKMSDYKVLYKNHPKFKEGSGNGKSSPVRIFTTIPLSLMKLPPDLYRYCDICQKWVERRNLHCDLCKTCPTKDGGETYIHCLSCKRCVKSTWSHCESPCGTCHLINAQCPTSNSSTINRINKKINDNSSMVIKPMASVGSKFKKSKKKALK